MMLFKSHIPQTCQLKPPVHGICINSIYNRYNASNELSSSNWTSKDITLLHVRNYISQQKIVDLVADGRNNETYPDSRSQYNFTVIVRGELKPDSLTHFWRSTGLWYCIQSYDMFADLI